MLLKKMLAYCIPMVIIGFAGIINEMLDRVILKFFLPYDMKTNMEMLGVYGACYKLSILMTLFIQAFRYAAEPFFFAQAKEKNSTKVYADVMKYFVIVCITIFLLVTLYLDLFKLFIGPKFRVGLPIVPILLLANLFLGVYVNLSIWYKLTDRTLWGSYVSMGGAVVTVVINVLFIPKFGYMASAWATLICYAGMALVSYLLGQKYYPVEYSVSSFVKYFGLALLLYFGFTYTNAMFALPPFVLSTVFMLVFLAFVWVQDGRLLVKSFRR